MEYYPDHLNTQSVEAVSQNDLRSEWVPSDKLDKWNSLYFSSPPTY